MATLDSFNSRQTLCVGEKAYATYSLIEAEKALPGISRLPFCLKVLLENLLRYEDGRTVKKEDVEAVAAWLDNKGRIDVEIAYRPPAS
jgi:aconitate hydratase